jgi:hypothetical protein
MNDVVPGVAMALLAPLSGWLVFKLTRTPYFIHGSYHPFLWGVCLVVLSLTAFFMFPLALVLCFAMAQKASSMAPKGPLEWTFRIVSWVFMFPLMLFILLFGDHEPGI